MGNDSISASLNISSYCHGAASSRVIDVIISGLHHIQLVAYGCVNGSVVIAYLLVSTCFVLDQLKNVDYARIYRSFSDLQVENASSKSFMPLTSLELTDREGIPLVHPVRHVCFGGGPHLLLAAATEDTLAVFSLEHLAIQLFNEQFRSFNNAHINYTLQANNSPAAVYHIKDSSLRRIANIDWTQQLDGILTAFSDGQLSMLSLQSMPSERKMEDVSGSPLLTISLNEIWTASASEPQDAISAGVTARSPCATCSGQKHSGSACVWWPEEDGVRIEKLKHPCKVVAVQWSPGLLLKDILGSRDSPDNEKEPDEISSLELSVDHPALLTTGEDGVLRLWVETLIIQHKVSTSSDESKDKPLMDSYFCMALVIDPPIMGQKVSACWARWENSLFGYMHNQSATNVFWILSIVESSDDHEGYVRLHALRGLSAVVVSSFGGSMSTAGAGGVCRKSQSVEWGHTTFPLSWLGGTLMSEHSKISCWITAEDEYPHVAVFASSLEGHGLKACGMRYSTIQSEHFGLSLPTKQLNQLVCWDAHSYGHQDAIISISASGCGLMATVDKSGCVIVWDEDSYQSLYFIPPRRESSGGKMTINWLPVADQGTLLVIATNDKLSCLTFEGSSHYIACSAQIPQALGTIVSVHVLAGSVIGAVCTVGKGGIALLCLWNCLPREYDKKLYSLRSIGTASLPGRGKPGETFTVFESSEKALLVGYSDGSIRKFSIQMEGTVNLKQEFKCVSSLNGPPVIIKEARVFGYIASVTDDGRLHIHSNSGEVCTIRENLSPVHGLAWIDDSSIPCLAVASGENGIRLLAFIENAWQCVAYSGMSATAPLVYSRRLFAPLDPGMVVFSDAVTIPDTVQSVPLRRLLFQRTGPLPLYHPTVLSILLLAGQLATLESILTSLAEWLQRFRVPTLAVDTESAGGLLSPGRPLTASHLMQHSTHASNTVTADLDPCSFPGIALADLIPSEFLSMKERLLTSASSMRNEDGASVPPKDPHSFDMASFGMSAPHLSSPTEFDLGSFGMGMPMAPPPDVGIHGPTSEATDSGMLNLASFGMHLPDAPPSLPQQAAAVEKPQNVVQRLLQTPDNQKLLRPQELTPLSSQLPDMLKSWEESFPGLTADETAHVVALAELLAPSRKCDSTLPVDTSGAMYCHAVLAAKVGFGIAPDHASPDSNSEKRLEVAVVKNAAGVSYTLPASLSKSTRGAMTEAKTHMNEAFGLLPGMPEGALLWAMMSGTEQGLLEYVVPDGQLAWERLRLIGAGFWLRDEKLLVNVAESIAKARFAASRNPDDSALLYTALKKKGVLRGLYSTTQNKKTADFLGRDFSTTENKQAAVKNAFVLMGKHRYELAAAFFILGESYHDAVGVCARDLRDPQLALFLARLLTKIIGSDIEKAVIDRYILPLALDSPFAKAACDWALGNIAEVVEDLLMPRGRFSGLEWQLPLIFHALSVVLPKDMDRNNLLTRINSCLDQGSHLLVAQRLPFFAMLLSGLNRVHNPASDSSLGASICAAALLVTGQQCSTQAHQLNALASGLFYWKEEEVERTLDGFGKELQLCSDEVTDHQEGTHLSRMNSEGTPRSMRSSFSGDPSGRTMLDGRRQLLLLKDGMSAILKEDHPLFRIENDKLESVCACALMSPDVLGRPVTVATHRHGLVEGEAHVLLPPQEMPHHHSSTGAGESTASLASDNENQRSDLFSRVLSQIFDQSGWAEEAWAGPGDADFSAAAAHAMAIRPSPKGQEKHSSSSISTYALCAHPSKHLYLSGDSTQGRVLLWKFGSRTSLGSFTPVPGSELAGLMTGQGGLLESFSMRLRPTPTAARLSSWRYCTDLAFSPNGERFAGVGAGGVVATWRLGTGSNTSRSVDLDGNIASEWWCHALNKEGKAVEFVGGGSTVIAVGGLCSSNDTIVLYDTLAASHTAGNVGRLAHHQSCVTSLHSLSGGWLLAAGDFEGALSVTDIRAMGGNGGARVLWSVRGGRGPVRSLTSVSVSGSSFLVSGGQDGALRVWNVGDGKLLQSLEAAHYTGGKRPSQEKLSLSAEMSPLSAGMGTPAPVTCVAACSEGVVSCGGDGTVRLWPLAL